MFNLGEVSRSAVSGVGLSDRTETIIHAFIHVIFCKINYVCA
jgi:hypothetical protein